MTTYPGTEPVLTGVQSRDVPNIWPHVEEMFADAMHRFDPDWTLEDIADALAFGEMQLWLVTSPGRAIEAAFTTRIMPRGCLIAALVGEDSDRWVPTVLRTVEAWARSLGCRKVFWSGRIGWVRKVKVPGYRVTRVTMEKDLSDG